MLQESNQTISIDGALIPLAFFLTQEPDYTPAPAGWVRYWGPDCQFLSDGNSQQPDPFFTPARLLAYESRVADYQAAQAAEDASILWVRCDISGGEAGHLYPFAVQGETTLTFDFRIEDAAGNLQTWLAGNWGICIHYKHEGRLRKVRRVRINGGAGQIQAYVDMQASGDFEIREETFAPITLPDGRLFTFRLAQPVIFTVAEA